jgi:hypothetical protein
LYICSIKDEEYMFDFTDLLGIAAMEEARREQEESDRLAEEQWEKEQRNLNR